jgi:hypothetical protein
MGLVGFDEEILGDKGEGRLTCFRGRPAGFFGKIDEVASYGHLGAYIAELAPDAEEEIVLFLQWAGVVFGNFDFLGSHVGI